MGFFDGRPLEAEATFVSRLCVQLVIILVLPRILHKAILERLLQPRVVSEIISGLILGPSCLGQINGFTINLFPTPSLTYLKALGQLGVVLFLFMTGCHLNFDRVMEVKWQALTASFVGTGWSLAIAPAISIPFRNPKYFINFDTAQSIILVAVILSISAEAVLARILAERGLLTSNIGSICMATSTVDVFVCFILLAAVLALHSQEHPWKPPTNVCPGTIVTNPDDAASTMDPLWIVLVFLGFILLVITVFRFYYTVLAVRVQQRGTMEAPTFVWAVVGCFAASWFTQTLTVSSLLGGLVLGLVGVPRIGTFCQNLEAALGPITVGILLPVFFCLVGLQTNFFLLSPYDVGLAFVLLAGLIASRFPAAIVTSTFFNGKGFKNVYFGALMSCKGLTVLTIFNTLLAVGTITELMYSIAVLYAVVSCILVSPTIAFFQILQNQVKKRKPEKEEQPKPRILCLPRTGYLAPVATSVASWLAKSFAMPVQIRFYRMIDDIENLDQFLPLFSKPIPEHVLLADAILGPCFVRWGGFKSADVDVSFRAAAARHLTETYPTLIEGAHNHGHHFDYQIIGFDNTDDTERLIRVGLHYHFNMFIVVTGHAFSSRSYQNVLVIEPAGQPPMQLTGIATPSLKGATIHIWNAGDEPAQRPPGLETHESVLHIFNTLEIANHLPYDLVFCPFASSLTESFELFRAAADCQIPVIFELIGYSGGVRFDVSSHSSMVNLHTLSASTGSQHHSSDSDGEPSVAIGTPKVDRDEL